MNRIKRYRQRQGITQLQLARHVHVARQTINQIENDRYNPSLNLCIKIAQTLDTDLNHLFWDQD